jgi:nucleoside-diphosphate-sugar epimerase
LWKERSVLVTGGASFIGSHLVGALLDRGAEVTVADNFSSGRLENLEYPMRQRRRGTWTSGNLVVHRVDLKDRSKARRIMKGAEVVFHLAAQHGGRGYIHTHPAECCTNMALDQVVFEEAWRANVDRVCFASSACVYPHYLQEEAGSTYLLKEEDADPFVRDRAFADLEYGYGKLMGEMTLKAYHKEYGLKASSVRIFTAYGERENETHAIIALVAKALVRMDPFEIWGTGEQDRNFTYVGDIVNAMMLAAEEIEDASPVNAGRTDRITLNQAADIVFKMVDWRPNAIVHDVSKPIGVASRAADLTKARAVLLWEPEVSYEEGFRRTIEWYRSHKDLDAVRQDLPRLLMER